jgi:hypothetical protein
MYMCLCMCVFVRAGRVGSVVRRLCVYVYKCLCMCVFVREACRNAVASLKNTHTLRYVQTDVKLCHKVSQRMFRHTLSYVIRFPNVCAPANMVIIKWDFPNVYLNAWSPRLMYALTYVYVAVEGASPFANVSVQSLFMSCISQRMRYVR